MERSRVQNNGYWWFRFWILTGIGIAVVLLANSISSYRLVSRKLVVDNLRREVAAQMSSLDQQLRAPSSSEPGRLNNLLGSILRQSNGRLAWIQVRDSKGSVVAQVGAEAAPAFSAGTVETKFRERQPVYTVRKTNSGEVLIEAFPIRLPGSSSPSAFRQVAWTGVSAPARPLGVVEFASFLTAASASAPLRWNLMINMAGALALLVALAVIALRFRSYLSGRKLEEQLEIARQVQRDLLPSPLALSEHFDLAAEWQTAARVGGDFYDAYDIPGKGSALVFGDVSGKDIPAAMLTGVIHGAVRSSSWTQSAADHNEATARMNRLFCDHASSERFVSMFWSYLDAGTELLHYVNAGHCPPLLFRASGTGPSRLRLCEGGPVLGLLENATYEQGVERLEPGDVMVMFSDGIIEAANAKGEEFGEQRLSGVVEQNLHATPSEIRDRILTAVRSFAGRSRVDDDQTLLVVRYSGAAARELQRAA
jgi:serine phosphatase RsbU (regulator of sigma subunit)